jgi:integrase
MNLMIDNSAGRWRPFFIAAIFTGMRQSELRGLRWSDVDLDAGVIHVRQRADGWGRMGPPKSKAGKRDIPLTPMAVNALSQWRKECPKSKLDLVFCTRIGLHHRPANIHKRAWVPLMLKCGLTVDSGEQDAEGNAIMVPRYHFHLLRHAAASLFIAHLKWPPKRIQTVMGHAKITLTFDLYGHLFENIEADREDMKKLEAAVRAA